MRGQLPCSDDLTPVQLAAHIGRLTARDGGSVQTFVSDHWTFEYDLAATNWKLATVMHQAICLAKASKTKWPDAAKVEAIKKTAVENVEEWQREGTALNQAAIAIYEPLRVDRRAIRCHAHRQAAQSVA